MMARHPSRMESMLKFRGDLSGPGLLNSLRSKMAEIADSRNKTQIEYPLVDVGMAGVALFSLKCPSLLSFDNLRQTPAVTNNLKTLFGVEKAPCDTQMREILDEVSPQGFRPSFKMLFAKAQRGKALEGYQFIDGSYLVSVDGTGYFSSKDIHCGSCCEKHHRDGTITYHHQMLPAVLVHPDQKQVIPMALEPIIKQDGDSKNDCERNAAKRLLPQLREDHPHLKMVIVEDGLASNAPHIRLIRSLDMGFILVAKEGDHESLFARFKVEIRLGTVTSLEIQEGEVLHRFRFINQICLNEANPDLFVNFLEYSEVRPEKQTNWSWVTHFELTKETVYQVMRGGRARWKIENETFNTLKNQGYQFEHNFGHGYKNLSVVLAHLMMLAFLIDQLQELCCKVFQKALEVSKSRSTLWLKMRTSFFAFLFESWDDFFQSLIAPALVWYPASNLAHDTS